ncbi:MAG: CpsD/CapB family tyrosine-protein kinase [Clostridium sp.]
MQIVEKEPRSSYAESFRSIKTNIKYSAFGKDKKVILITSANPGEGKSTTASNLALTLSMDNKKVILLDCDLRRPTIHKSFNISGLVGLSELIIEEKELGEVITKYNENLDIIPAGNIPPNPAELLASEQMQNVLDELRLMYDYIIVDTTPLGVVADAQILTSKTDGTILVARQSKTKKDKLTNCKKMVEQVNGKIIGVIINRVNQNGKDYYYYY